MHSSLANSLSKHGVPEQFVYCPLQRGFKVNEYIELNDSVIVSSPRIFNQTVRFFPFVKVAFSCLFFFASLRKYKVKPSFIIAHNLWSDGMVAWIYSKCTGVPFIAAVRNTDLNHFIPKLPHYRWLIKLLVKDARHIVFINNAYNERVRKDFPCIYNEIKSKSVVYNGVNDDWLSFSNSEAGVLRAKKVCFVGGFLRNKNLKNSVLAIQMLRDEGEDVKYVAIGGNEKEFIEVTGLCKIPDWVEVVSRTSDQNLIASHLRNSRVFLMPSFKETFGLVYIEALSQGCCIVHSQGEGIDGAFNEPFIESVNPRDVDDIACKVRSLLGRYPEGVPIEKVEELIAQFSWDDVAEKYLDIIRWRG